MHLKLTQIALVATCAAISLSAFAEPFRVMAAEAKPVSMQAEGQATRGAVLKTFGAAMVNGDRIGATRSGQGCEAVTERDWSDMVGKRVASEVQGVFREQFPKAIYVSSHTGSGADDTGPLEVSAVLNDLDVQVCNVGQGAWHGGFYVRVSWQAALPESQRIVYRTSTEGSFQIDEPKQISGAAGFREAFAMAVRNLLADRRFHALLQNGADNRAIAEADLY